MELSTQTRAPLQEWQCTIRLSVFAFSNEATFSTNAIRKKRLRKAKNHMVEDNKGNLPAELVLQLQNFEEQTLFLNLMPSLTPKKNQATKARALW